DGASSTLAMIYEVDTLARQLPSSTDHSHHAERQGEIAMKVIGRLLVSALGFSLAIGVATAAVALEIRWGVGPDGGTPASDGGGTGKELYAKGGGGAGG